MMLLRLFSFIDYFDCFVFDAAIFAAYADDAADAFSLFF